MKLFHSSPDNHRRSEFLQSPTLLPFQDTLPSNECPSSALSLRQNGRITNPSTILFAHHSLRVITTAGMQSTRIEKVCVCCILLKGRCPHKVEYFMTVIVHFQKWVKSWTKKNHCIIDLCCWFLASLPPRTAPKPTKEYITRMGKHYNYFEGRLMSISHSTPLA